MAPQQRIPQLDGIRGLAAAMVVVYHYVVVPIETTPCSWAADVQQLCAAMRSGVDLFFVLSGFLIVGILLDNREAANAFRTFLARRITRIFPLYYAWLAVYVVLAAWLGGQSRFDHLFGNALPLWHYATFTQNFEMAASDGWGANFLAVTWSLAVEEQFYVIVPLLALGLPRRALASLIVAAIVAVPLARHGQSHLYGYLPPLCRMDSLASGGLLAILVRSPNFVTLVRRRQGLLAIALAGLNFLAAGASWLRPWADQHIYSVFAALYATLVLIAYLGTLPRLIRILSVRPLVWIGTVSYGIYLFHQAVSGLLHGAILGRAPRLTNLTEAGVTVLALGVTLALAATSFRFFEAPIQRLGQAVRYRRNSATSLERAPALA